MCNARLSRNPSSLNKTRTPDTSTCTGFPATSRSSSDNTAPDHPEFDLPEFDRTALVRPHSLPAGVTAGSCLMSTDATRRSHPDASANLDSATPTPLEERPAAHSIRPSLWAIKLGHQAARSLTASGVRLQQSAISRQAPSRFHTFT